MKILITGSGSGLGRALMQSLAADHTCIPYDLAQGNDVLNPANSLHAFKNIDCLINCAGINAIDWLEDVSDADWDAVIDTNVKGIFKMTQHYLPWLRANNGVVLNIVSNAAHMPMRCSAAYNASKAAALMLTKQFARELSSDGITVFSVSPNRLCGTAMSQYIDDRVTGLRGWTMEQAREYQLSSLLAGEETPPCCVADFIAFLLSNKQRHKFLTGCDIPYGA